MTTHIRAGAVLALVAAGTLLLGEWLGLELTHVALLGVAIGGAVGLVPDRTHGQRVIAFVIGLLIAWAGYGLRAGMLPDTDLGRALALFAVVIVAMVVAAATAGRLPLWAMLLGMAALAGAYEYTYAASPTLFATESVTAVTTVLLAASLGNLATLLLGVQIEQDRAAEHRAQEVAR